MEKYRVRAIPRRKFLEMSMKGGLLVAASPMIMSNLISCSSPAIAGPGLDLDRSVLDKVISKALAQGGDFADVYLENRTSRQIIMEESLFRSGLYGIVQGAGVRVVSGDKTGFAYTDDISEENLMRAAEVASYIARNSPVTTPVNISEASRDSFVTVGLPLENVHDSKRIEIMQRANQAAMDYDKRIKMVKVDYYDQVRGRVIANSEGLYLKR
jgi:TldD protein